MLAIDYDDNHAAKHGHERYFTNAAAARDINSFVATDALINDIRIA